MGIICTDDCDDRFDHDEHSNKRQTSDSKDSLLEEKLEAHLFIQEGELLGDIMSTIFFPSENYAFQRHIVDSRYGSSKYMAGDNQKYIESNLKPLIGKKPEYKGKFYFSKEEFNKLKAMAEKYMEARGFEKSIDDLINKYKIKK